VFKISVKDSSKYAYAVNHYELVQRYKDFNLPISNLEDLNTFRYWSYPYVGTAKLLMTEKSLFDADVFNLQSAIPSEEALAQEDPSLFLSGITKKITLNIIGNIGSVTFDDMEIVQLERVMASLDNSLYSNDKLIIVHLSQSREDYSRNVGTYSYSPEFFKIDFDGTNIKNYLPAAGSVTPVDKIYLPQLSFAQRMGYVADIQMATIYRNKSNAFTKSRDAVTRSDLKLDRHRLLYSRYFVTNNQNKFIEISFSTKSKNTIELLSSLNDPETEVQDVITIDGNTEFPFNAPPPQGPQLPSSPPHYETGESPWPMNNASNSIEFYYPFYQLDVGATELDADAITIADEIKDNAKKRLANSFHLVLEDIVDIDPKIDIQQITYSLSRNGPVTEIKTIPWSLPTYVELPVIESSSSSIEFEIDSVTTDDDEESPYYNLQIATVTIRSASCELSDLIGTQVDVVDHSECLFDGANSVGLWGWATQRVAKSTASGADPSAKSPCHWAADNICC